MTIEIKSDRNDVLGARKTREWKTQYVFSSPCIRVCVRYASWLVLSSTGTYHFLTDDSLQSADNNQQESRAVAGKPHVRCRCKIR